MGRRWAGTVVTTVACAGVLAGAGPAEAVVSVNRSADALTITDSGASSSDVAVSCVAGRNTIVVDVNGGSTSHGTCTSLRTVTVSLGAGTDDLDTSGLVLLAADRPPVPITVDLTGLSLSLCDGPCPPDVNTFTGGPLPELVQASSPFGTSTITAGAGNDVIVAPGSGSVDGGDGLDELRATGSATLTATHLQRPAGGLGATIPHTGIEQALLTGTGGTDTLDATVFPGRADLAGGDGDDVLAPGIRGDVDGGGGADTLRLTGGSLTVTDTAISGDAPRVIAGIERLEFSGGGGDDELNASGFSGAVSAGGGPGSDRLTAGSGGATLSGGDGDDTVTLGPGVDSADGGAGTDTLVATAAGAFALTPGTAGPDAHAGFETLTVRGSDGADQLDVTAAPGPVTVQAGAGDDVVLGGASGDVLDGGPGDDTLAGGAGGDALRGGDGSDTVSYEGPAAVVVDLAGAPSGVPGEGDVLTGVERVLGSSGPDRLLGTDGPDTLLGGPGADHLDGRGGPDVLDGQGGPDFLEGGPGLSGDGDQLLGGAGFDVLSYADRTRPVRVTLDGVADDGDPGENDQADPTLEAVVGGSAADLLSLEGAVTGTRALRQAARATLKLAFGGAGDDTLLGSAGPDVLGGGTGKDVVKAGAGNDAVHGGSGDDDLDAGDGNDRVYPQRGKDLVQTGVGDDTVFSLDNAADRIRCGTGADRVFIGKGDVPRADCERGLGRSKAAPAKPAAPGEPATEATTEAATDCTLEDGDGFFCPEGDEPLDTDGDGVSALGGDPLDFGFSDDLFGFADDFGAEFDDDFFGEGFDDFGDAFGEDLGGKDPPAPSLRTKQLRITKSRTSVSVTCPKKVDRRCIGEVTAALPNGREVGTGLFAINAGKRATVRVKLSKKGAAAVRKAKAKRLAVTLEGRDRGSALWQVTKTLKLAAPKKSKKKR